MCNMQIKYIILETSCKLHSDVFLYIWCVIECMRKMEVEAVEDDSC